MSVEAPPHPADAMDGIAPTLSSDAAPTAPNGAAPGPDDAPAEPEEPASETLYIQNLNERVRVTIMKQTLRALFKTYGDVLDVVAHKNLRMRGQAFVSFPDAELAAKARREVNAFPLYGKPMQISFAKTRSDEVVRRLDANNYDEHKTRRDAHKKATRYSNPIKSKMRAKKLAAEGKGDAAAAPTRRPAVQMPDEYLPPNKILFVQNLPDGTTHARLSELFGPHPGLHEVRMIPTKKDIAFVEFVDEAASAVAKDALHNFRIDGEHKIKITFARKT